MRSLIFILKPRFPIILLSLLFSSCSSKEKQAEVIDQRFQLVQASLYAAPFNVDLPIHPLSLIGEWNSSGFIYSTDLSIKPDSTFIFELRGCTGTCYSEGKWTSSGGILILKSHERFNPNKKKINSATLKTFREGLYLDMEPLLAPVRFDSTTKYFDFVSMRIEGDTLYELDRFGLKTDIKYVLINR